MAKTQRNRSIEAEKLFVAAEKHEDLLDFRRAFRCLLSAANLGHVNSMINLGNMLSSGIGVRRNRERASFWYKKAYRAGSAVAARNYAVDLVKAGKVKLAESWFRRAIDMRDASSYVALARIYAGKHETSAAVSLLIRVQRLSKENASELDREQATELLRRLQGISDDEESGRTYH